MAITKNVRMLMVNDADTAALSLATGSEVATLPLTNVQLPSNSRTFRSLDIAQVQIVMTWQNPVLLSGVALNRINVSDGATWRVEVFSDVAMTTLIHDSLVLQAVQQKNLGELEFLIDPLVSAVVSMKITACDYWFESGIAQAVRITIIDVNNANGFIDIGRIFAGRALQPKINFSYGHKSGWISQTEKRRTAGGSVHAKKKARPRKLSFSLKYLDELDRPHFYNAIQRVGDDTTWYISMFPGVGGQKERQYAMSCMFEILPEIDGAFYNNFKADFTIREA
ncbi:hypothetical protein A9Q74_06335 [Colwellia sp. 39_35_sub15_T18]|nr:hypothetical protein A9Q74_06335 [Colwellia sp. 39_35_sub15_T18]